MTTTAYPIAVHQQHRRFRDLIAPTIAIYEKPSHDDYMWMFDCYASIDAFVLRFPSIDDRERIIRKLDSARADVAKGVRQIVRLTGADLRPKNPRATVED